MRVTINDALDPKGRQLGRIATVTSRQERGNLREAMIRRYFAEARERAEREVRREVEGDEHRDARQARTAARSRRGAADGNPGKVVISDGHHG